MLRRLGRGRIAVNTVWAKLLDDAQLLDVAGNGSLRGRETGLVQLSEQLLLRLDAVVCDKLQNFSWRFDFIDVFTSFFNEFSVQDLKKLVFFSRTSRVTFCELLTVISSPVFRRKARPPSTDKTRCAARSCRP